MWTPQLQPTEFPWAEIKARYPAAYAALFDTSGTIGVYTLGDAPHQLLAYSSEEARAGGNPETARDFRLRDLYEFFDAHGLHISVQPASVWLVDWDKAVKYGPEAAQSVPHLQGWGYAISTGGGMGPMADRGQAESAAFLVAFAALNGKLTPAQQPADHVEASAPDAAL